LQVAGGNKHRTGYSYKIIAGRDYTALQDSITQQIEQVLQKIGKAHQEREKQPRSPRQKPPRPLPEAVSQ
jgi:hypothetical protein